jgi:hypothetical protein
MNAGVKTASKTMEMVKPFPFIPLNELTRDVVKSYVDAQKSLMDVMVKAPNGAKPVEHRTRKPGRRAKAAAAVA